jgi:hypothetical protein
MRRSGTSLATALVCLLAALSLPTAASASATVRYVATGGKDNPTCAQSEPCLTIHNAITIAQAGDTISIGPGTFHEGEMIVEKALDFSGAGAGTAATYDPTHDTLIDGSGQTGETISDGAGGSFSDLRINGGIDSGGVFEQAYAALYLHASSESASFNVSDVVTTQPLISIGSGNASIDLEANSIYTNTSTITDLTAIGTGAALELNSSGMLNLNLSHSTLTGGTGGEAALVSGGSTNATLSNTTLGGSQFGAVIYTGGQLTATRDSFTGRNAGLKLRSYENGASAATLRDSLAAALPSVTSTPQAGVVLLAEKAGSTATLSATNSTLVAYGKGATAGLQLESTTNGGTSTAQLANTIAFAADPTAPGTPRDILAAGPGTATVTAESSGYSTVSATSGATITPVGSPGNVSGNPAFANPAGGNFMLAATSPLLELGNPALVLAGELDLASNPRLEIECGRSLNPDIGAYELPRAFACPISAGGPSAGGPGSGSKVLGAPKVPMIDSASISGPRRARHRKHARAGKLVFTLSEAATVDVQLEQLAKGHLRKKACIAKVKACKRLITISTTHLTGTAGKNTVALPSVNVVGHLKAANYELVLIAVSAQGTHSAPRTVKFALR